MRRRRGVILLYHRVADCAADLHGMCVTAERLERQLEHLHRRCDVVPLREIAEPGGRERAAVTFDDGYADNLAATEVLARTGTPATFFVTVGRIGIRREFWWDELEQLVDAWPASHESLDTEIAGRRLFVDARSQAARARLYWALYRRLWPLPIAEIENVLDGIRGRIGMAARMRETHRALTQAEVRALARAPLFEVGSHSLSHAVLSEQSHVEQRREIEGSLAGLESLLQRRVESFSYPHGRYSRTTLELVSEAGYARACCSIPGLVSRRTSGLELPREAALNWDTDEFASRLEHWLAGRPQRRAR